MRGTRVCTAGTAHSPVVVLHAPSGHLMCYLTGFATQTLLLVRFDQVVVRLDQITVSACGFVLCSLQKSKVCRRICFCMQASNRICNCNRISAAVGRAI